MNTVDLGDINERLAKIAEYADGLTDFLGDEGWSLAYCIREMATGKLSPAEADEFVGEH